MIHTGTAAALQPPCSEVLVLSSVGHCSDSELRDTPPRFQTLFGVELKAFSKPFAYKRNISLVECHFLPHFYLLFTFFWLFPEAIYSGQGDSPTLGMFACSFSNMNANITFTSTIKLHSLFLNRKFINCYVTDMQQRPGPYS